MPIVASVVTERRQEVSEFSVQPRDRFWAQLLLVITRRDLSDMPGCVLLRRDDVSLSGNGFDRIGSDRDAEIVCDVADPVLLVEDDVFVAEYLVIDAIELAQGRIVALDDLRGSLLDELVDRHRANALAASFESPFSIIAQRGTWRLVADGFAEILRRRHITRITDQEDRSARSKGRQLDRIDDASEAAVAITVLDEKPTDIGRQIRETETHRSQLGLNRVERQASMAADRPGHPGQHRASTFLHADEEAGFAVTGVGKVKRNIRAVPQREVDGRHGRAVRARLWSAYR